MSATLPIDLQPPAQWLDAFPLSQRPFKELNTYFEGASRLPDGLEDLKKHLSFDESVVNEFRELIDPLVEVYVKFRAHAAKYGAEVLPHIISLAQAFHAHTSIVKPFYTALYTSILGDPRINDEWSNNFLGFIIRKVVTKITAISNEAERTATEMRILEKDIDDVKKAVTTNLRLLERRECSTSKDSSETGGTAKGSLQRTQGGTQLSGDAPEVVNQQPSPSDTLKIQNEVFCSSLDIILQNIRDTTAIVESIRTECRGIHDKFITIAEKIENTSEPIPANLLVPDLSTVIEKWGRVRVHVESYLLAAHLVDGESSD